MTETNVMDAKVETDKMPAVDNTTIIKQLVEANKQLIEMLEKLSTQSIPRKNGRGGKKAGKLVIDTKTGTRYPTKASAGKAVCEEYGLKSHNFVWYEVIKADPTRFVDAQ